MKVAVITDTHYGARKGSKLFHDYFEKFYRDVFFPNLKKYGVDTVIHLGDCLLYTSPSPRDATLSRMPSSA